METSDRTLLDRYLTGGDEAAFGMLVGRYLDFVHALALRVTGNEEMARDVAQLTFVRLAQRAALIPHDLTLSAWLHRIARGLAVDQVRAESRRKKRELGSTYSPSPMDAPDPEPNWSALAPVIDELVDRLPAADRDLLLLRYYRNQSHAVIAARLGLTESVARKRAFRAVEKLRVLLGKRGIATSAAALATLLPAHASPAAPALLSASVLQVAQGITPIAPHFLNTLLLTVTTSQKVALAGALALLLAATGYTFSPDPAAGIAVSSATAAIPSGKRGEELGADRARRTRPAPATAEERRARLEVIMAISNPSERHAELISYLDGLPPGLFEETAKDLTELAREPDSAAIHLVLSAWTKVDPPAALAFTLTSEGNPDFDREEIILRDWAAMDPQAAMKWAAAREPFEATESLKAILLAVARTAPEEVAKRLAELADPELQEAAIHELVHHFAKNPAMVERIMASATEAQKPVFLGIYCSNMEDWVKAAAILNEHPEILAFTRPQSIYGKWVHHDFTAATAAVAAVAEMPAGELRKKAAEGIIETAAYREPTKALELAALYPESVPDRVRITLIEQIGKNDPELALEQTTMLSEAERRNSIVLGQLKSWIAKDRAAAEQWIEAHPQPSFVMDQLPPAP